MFYGSYITYNQAGYTYAGSLHINVPGNSNPIVVSNVTFIFSTSEDLSNMTTIGFINLEIEENGIISVIPQGQEYLALLSADVMYITGENQISIAQ